MLLFFFIPHTNPPDLKQEFFLQAIRDLELEQLHAEAARLQLSLYHLRRSQIALEEFRDDPICRSAIEDNKVVIGNQVDRIDLIRLEVERRGFSMEHGVRTGENLVNGNAGAGLGEDSRRGVIMGGIGNERHGDGGAAVGEPAATDTAARGSTAGDSRREDMEGVRAEEEGIYL